MAQQNKEKTIEVEDELNKIKDVVDDLQKQLRVANAQIDDQVNRNMRKTLVIRGISQTDKKELWEDTSNHLANKISQITNNEITKVDVLNSIERAHRTKVFRSY